MNKYACIVLVISALLSGSCTTVQVFPATQQQQLTLTNGDLVKGGVAFITPSTVTGQEEEKQAVALIFAQVLRDERPGLIVVTLAEALSAINKAGLSDDYKRMYEEYRDTGLFKSAMLRRIGELAGVRYVAQIKLQGFTQGAKERFGAFGFRLVETRYANVRMFLQIWDAEDGTIAWEGIQETLYSREGINEEPITLQLAVERAARSLVKTLPTDAAGKPR
jgi:hypothetical protein